MRSTIQDYLAELKGKRVAVIGIGVSNTPLIKMLLRAGIRVTACDKRQKQEFGGQAEALESLGAELRLGPDYLEGLDHDVIFRTPGLRPTSHSFWRRWSVEACSPPRWRFSFRYAPVTSSPLPAVMGRPRPRP